MGFFEPRDPCSRFLDHLGALNQLGTIRHLLGIAMRLKHMDVADDLVWVLPLEWFASDFPEGEITLYGYPVVRTFVTVPMLAHTGQPSL